MRTHLVAAAALALLLTACGAEVQPDVVATATDDSPYEAMPSDGAVDAEGEGDPDAGGGERADDDVENTSNGQEAAFAEALALAVGEYRDSGQACDGEAAEAMEGMVDHLTLGLEGGTVVAVLCDSFAYQSSWELMAWDGEALLPLAVEQWDDDIVQRSVILGYPDVDTDELVNLEKARGVADCGKYQTWVRDDQGLRLVSARVRDCDDSSAYAEPDQWPLVYPSDA